MSASYYLYQKYEQRGEQEPIPVYPNVFSIDGDGTMPKVIKQKNDPNCGYVPPVTPIYRWTNIEVSSDYICDECPTAQYRWVESGVTCVGYDKYVRNIKQKSYDGGSTWTNVSPLEISASTLIETNSIDCGYVPITERKFLLTYNDGTSYSAYCNSSTTLTESEVKPTYFDNTKMTTAEIGDCVRTIGGYSFYNCSGLTSVTIPSGVTEINYNAFNGCTSLTGITVYATTPPTLDSAALTNTNNCTIFVPCDSIDAYKSAPVWNNYSSRIQGIGCFNGKFKATYSHGRTYSAECDSSTDLTSATTKPSGYQYTAMTTAEIGDCITSIDEYAFAECYSLTSITIPDSVTSIGIQAFFACRSLTSITIPDSVASIGDWAFASCSSLTSITIPDSVTSIDYGAFSYCSSLTSITIPDSVTSIGRQSFYRCSGLTSITIPDSVTSIGGDAFTDCSGLTEVTIPDSVTSIGIAAFYRCSGLISMVVDAGNTVYDSRNNCNAIIETSRNKLIAGCKNTVIPNTVTMIGDFAFADCSGLTGITIPDSVTSIGRQSFYRCSGLTSITIPDSVIVIYGDAFANCTSLTSITINAITPPKLGTSAFNNTNNCPIYVPASSLDTYKNATNWSYYASRIYPVP